VDNIENSGLVIAEAWRADEDGLAIGVSFLQFLK
jgi:hypothetical protein